MSDERIVWAIKTPGGWSSGGVWLNYTGGTLADAKLYGSRGAAQAVVTRSVRRGLIDGRLVEIAAFRLVLEPSGR